MKHHLLLITHSNFSVLNLELGVQTNYPLALMFFFRTLPAAFPTSYRMKTVCSSWVWKLSNDASTLYIMHFIIQSALLHYSFPFLVLVCYIRLVYCMSNFQIVSIALTSLVKDTFCLQLCQSNSKLVWLASIKRVKVLGIGNSFLY